MKTVIVVYNECINFAAIKHNQDTLSDIFNHQLCVENRYYDQMDDGEQLHADAYLLSNEGLLHPMRRHISDFKRIIIMERTLQRSQIHSIMDIPADSDVLLVNDSIETSVHTVYMLYALGISHLNLIPYDSSLEETGIYRGISHAVTPGERRLVPPYISHVVDCLYRVVSFKTLISLSNILGLDSDVIHRNLLQYMHSLAEVDADFHSNYLKSHLQSQMLNLIVRDSDSAIIVVNDSYQLIYTNELAEKVLKLSDSSVLPPAILHLFRSSASNTLITIYDENFVFENAPLMLMDQLMGYCITLHNENTLREIEYNLNSHLRQKGLYARHHFQDIIHKSPAMEASIRLAKQAAVTDCTVLLRGESGSGKELFAQAIHNFSRRSSGPFVAVNCAALAESLLESQLFGYEDGAFTGARKGGKAGLFEQAHRGTIFLDEIGDISPHLQSQLLRVLQEKQLMRIGSDKIISIDVRIIAATNRDLEQLIDAGAFRRDLFFRLNVIPMEIPPLRNRRDDILPLFFHFLGNGCAEIAPWQQQCLLAFDWPGNVRQLENAATYYKALGQFPDYLAKARPYPQAGIPSGVCGAPSVSAGFDVFKSPGSPSPAFPRDLSLSSGPACAAAPDAPLLTRTSVQAMRLLWEREILSILYCTTEPSHGIGREALLCELKARGLAISSNRLRTVLSELAQRGLLTVQKGRAGCRITEADLHHLSSFTNPQDDFSAQI